jgi:fumarylacetoacetate (FAA) hydrolase family protein
MRLARHSPVLANTTASADESKPYFLAPCDLQVVKAAGVTFAASMLERATTAS